MAKTNAFDELLASVESVKPEYRQALAEIAEAVPDLRDGYLRKADYSRKSDELKSEREKFQERLSFADQYDAWWKENYVPNALGEGQGATKRELEYRKQAEEIQAKLEEAHKQISVGGEVTFDQLNEQFNSLMKQHNLVRQADVEKAISDKAAGVEKGLNATLGGYAHVATKAPKIAIRHFLKFKEEPDIDAIVDFAAKNNYQDLEKAYGDFVAPRIKELEQKEFESKLEAARTEGREAAMKEKGMSPGQMPVDNTPPTMGAFQQKLMGLKQDSGGIEIPEGATPGDGSIAAIVARAQNFTP